MSVVILDRDDTRTLEHYDVCDEDSAPDVKRARGIIRDETQVVCQSFGFTAEYDVDSPKWKDLLRECVQTCTIFRSEEGTLLRLYFHGDTWHLSTHKRLDAFESRWSSALSFGELFLQALTHFFIRGEGVGTLEVEKEEEVYDRFCATLDRECVYSFLLRTNADTKIVCAPPAKPTVFFAGQFYHGLRCEGNPTPVPFPHRVRFDTPEGLEEYVRSLEPLKHQGVIVFLPDQTVFKVVHPEYSSYAALRGSEPSLFRAYLRIRQKDEDLHRFLTVFPERRNQVLGYEDQILSLGKLVQRYYVRRFIRKEQLMVNKNYFYVMRLAHQWHCSNRDANIVTLPKILELLDEQQPHFLYTLLTVRE